MELYDTIKRAGELLSEAYNRNLELSLVHDFERQYQVLRINTNDEQIGNVIVKHYVNEREPVDHRKDDDHRQQQFMNELLNLQFLSRLNLNCIPQVLASSKTDRIMILEDFGDVPTIMDQLYDKKSDALNLLYTYFSCLAELHAKTIGKSTKYTNVRETYLQKFGTRSLISDSNLNLEQFQDSINEIENYLQYEKGKLKKLISQIHEITHENPDFHGYIHCDTGPQNLLQVNGNAKLIDHDYGTFGLIFVDIAGAFLAFPQSGRGLGIPMNLYENMLNYYTECLNMNGFETLYDDVVKFTQYGILHWLIGRFLSLWSRFLKERLDEGEKMEDDLPFSKTRLYQVRDKFLSMFDRYLTYFGANPGFEEFYLVISDFRNIFAKIWNIPKNVEMVHFPIFR